MSALFLISGCSHQSRDQDTVEIRKVLETRAKAIESKDIALYQSVFMPEYFDGKTTLQDIVDDMQTSFSKFAHIRLKYQKSPIEFKMNSARVIERITYNVVGIEKPVYDHEILLMRNVDGKWYISGGVKTGLLVAE